MCNIYDAREFTRNSFKACCWFKIFNLFPAQGSLKPGLHHAAMQGHAAVCQAETTRAGVPHFHTKP
jgi:hypothetical protein